MKKGHENRHTCGVLVGGALSFSMPDLAAAVGRPSSSLLAVHAITILLIWRETKISIKCLANNNERAVRRAAA